MAEPVDQTDARRPRSQPAELDRAIAELAALQHGVVSRAQLAALGLHQRAIGRRLERGYLHRVHHATYAVGHPLLSLRGRCMAATLAGGAAAVLSHRSAAALWELRGYEGEPEITVTVKGRSIRGVKARYALLGEDEIAQRAGVPVTTVARTLLDVGSVLEDHRVEKAIRSADYLGLFDLDEVTRLVERYPRRHGTAAIRAAIRAAAASRGRTRSDFEDRFVSLILKANLPGPELNGTIDLGAMTVEADVVWRPQKLIVELDGRAAHGSGDAFEIDRERDRSAALAGWLVIRVTWRQFSDDPHRMVADLKRLLKARG